MEIKKCETCDKVISDVSIHKDTVLFCDKDCLREYCIEYAYDNYEIVDPMNEPIDRNDLD